MERRDTARQSASGTTSVADEDRVAHQRDATSGNGPTEGVAHLQVVDSSPAAAAKLRRLRSTIQPRTTKRWLILADVVASLIGIGFAFLAEMLWWPVDSDVIFGQWLVVLASVPFWYASGAANHLYAARANQRRLDEFKHIVSTALFGVASMVGVAFVFGSDDLSRSWVAMVFVGVVGAVTIERQLARVAFHRLRLSGRMSRPILVVGTDENAADLVRTVQDRPELGYHAVGIVDAEPTSATLHGVPLVGDLSRVEDVAAERGASGVLISLYSVDGATVNALSRRLTDAGLHVTLVSSLHDIDINRLRVQEIDGRTLMYIEPAIRTGWRYLAMRAFDYTVSALALLLALPILLVAALAIKLDSKGPVLFRQVRTGVNGQLFEILKLRTMCDGADSMKAELADQNESDGPLFKMRDDPRMTRVGKVLRKFSIDEFPQFWNVLRGEMSVVGPRPALPSEVALWEEDVHERLRVLPGVTGMWQVSGRADTSFEDYKRLDRYYIDNWSLAHDIRIVVKTVAVVFGRRGAS